MKYPYRIVRCDILTAYEKTVELLRAYKNYKHSIEAGIGNTITEETVSTIEEAFKYLNMDRYYYILQLYYVENMSMERISEVMWIDPRTAYRQRKRLIREMSKILFSDLHIEEVLEGKTHK